MLILLLLVLYITSNDLLVMSYCGYKITSCPKMVTSILSPPPKSLCYIQSTLALYIANHMSY